jgi:hypothetical protein
MSGVTNIRDWGAAAMLLASTALVSRAARADGAKLLVFVHVAVKQRALQSQLQGALPGIDVTAVGRISDFERTLKQGADAVLALPIVLEAFRLSVGLRGHRGGSPQEPYSLVAAGAAPDPHQVAAVGALDVLGRDGTNSFLKDLLGRACRVERVSKVEDLLPLLQMQRVEAILLPARLVSEVKAASKLDLVGTELSKKVGLPAAASVTAMGSQVISALGKMPTNALRILGVDSWR